MIELCKGSEYVLGCHKQVSWCFIQRHGVKGKCFMNMCIWQPSNEEMKEKMEEKDGRN